VTVRAGTAVRRTGNFFPNKEEILFVMYILNE